MPPNLSILQWFRKAVFASPRSMARMQIPLTVGKWATVSSLIRRGAKLLMPLPARLDTSACVVGTSRQSPPGAETIQELFGGEPTLILLDELSVYLRKVQK